MGPFMGVLISPIATLQVIANVMAVMMM